MTLVRVRVRSFWKWTGRWCQIFVAAEPRTVENVEKQDRRSNDLYICDPQVYCSLSCQSRVPCSSHSLKQHSWKKRNFIRMPSSYNWWNLNGASFSHTNFIPVTGEEGNLDHARMRACMNACTCSVIESAILPICMFFICSDMPHMCVLNRVFYMYLQLILLLNTAIFGCCSNVHYVLHLHFSLLL